MDGSDWRRMASHVFRVYILEDVDQLCRVEARTSKTKRFVDLQMAEQILGARFHDKVQPIRVLERAPTSISEPIQRQKRRNLQYTLDILRQGGKKRRCQYLIATAPAMRRHFVERDVCAHSVRRMHRTD
jgi:3-methyladenine DNA glycosylase/8-oxoguanine DNA glycosylase